MELEICAVGYAAFVELALGWFREKAMDCTASRRAVERAVERSKVTFRQLLATT